jgi:hypothetical protein
LLLASARSDRRLRWIGSGAVGVHEFHALDLPAMADWIEQCSERREMDFADATLVWLAGRTDSRRVMTTHVRDFSRYRLAGRKTFEIV